MGMFSQKPKLPTAAAAGDAPTRLLAEGGENPSNRLLPEEGEAPAKGGFQEKASGIAEGMGEATKGWDTSQYKNVGVEMGARPLHEAFDTEGGMAAIGLDPSQLLGDSESATNAKIAALLRRAGAR